MAVLAGGAGVTVVAGVAVVGGVAAVGFMEKKACFLQMILPCVGRPFLKSGSFSKY